MQKVFSTIIVNCSKHLKWQRADDDDDNEDDNEYDEYDDDYDEEDDNDDDEVKKRLIPTSPRPAPAWPNDSIYPTLLQY